MRGNQDNNKSSTKERTQVGRGINQSLSAQNSSSYLSRPSIAKHVKKAYYFCCTTVLSTSQITLAPNESFKNDGTQCDTVRSTPPVFSDPVCFEHFNPEPEGPSKHHPTGIVHETQDTSKQLWFLRRWSNISKATMITVLCLKRDTSLITRQYTDILSVLKWFGVGI